MAANLKIALSLFVAAQTLILVSGFVLFAIIGEVNRRLSDQQQFSYLWGHFSKYVDIFREYRHLYPAGRLDLYCKVFLACGFILLLGSAWKLGLFQ